MNPAKGCYRAMSFIENLKQKMHIDRLAASVKSSIGPVGGEKKIDKASMRALLGMTPYRRTDERDLELYVREAEVGPPHILVLDNEIALYRTTIGDVCLRKSPTVKEMLSIRKAIKILNDQDVLISKRTESLAEIHRTGIGLLDLALRPADIDMIAGAGIRAFESRMPENVLEAITLLGELIGLTPAPKGFSIRDFTIMGRMEAQGPGLVSFGPMVVYGDAQNILKLILTVFSSREKDRLDRIQAVALGEADADREGPDVFRFLAEMARSAHWDPYHAVNES